MTSIPPVLYAKSGDLSIAYSVVGSGPVDLVWAPGFVSHLEIQWEHEMVSRGPRLKLAEFTRLIIFDKRGTGMSDRPAGIPTLEERIDDIRAVMDAAKSERAHLWGISEALPMSVLFAATFPQRTRSLILYGGRARFTRAPDYPWGPTPEQYEETLQRSIARDFRDDFTTPEMQRWLGDVRHDREFLEFYARYVRHAATPAARAALARMNRLIDVRDILPTIRVPTLIIGKTGDPVMPPDCAQDLASRIPGARLVVLPGDGHIFGNVWPDILGTIREWVTEAAVPVATDRFLATILFVDLVRSTQRVAAMGDAAWRDLLAKHYAAARRHLAVYGGVEVDTAGDGLLAHFDGPQRAIRCARAIQRSAAELGLEARAGVHTGEVERSGTAIRGIAVHLASRVASIAGAQEVLVTSTVRDLVAGSGLTFTERGVHELKGIPEPRQVLAVASA
jgi:class 3 adenylate cyclase/pimeloyl-ACP methyl ester carboxylesterase